MIPKVIDRFINRKAVLYKILLAFSMPLLFTTLSNVILQKHVLQVNASDNSDIAKVVNTQGEHLVLMPVLFNHYVPPTWEYVGLSGKVTDLVFDPINPLHSYASVYFEGLFETQNGGVSWEKHEQITLTTRINDIEIHSLSHTTYLATWGGYSVYQHNEGDDYWQPVAGWHYLYPTIYSVAVHPYSPTVMLAGSGNWEPNGGEIYKSTNSGLTWQAVSPMFTNALTFAFDPVNPSVLYAGAIGGVWKSEDGGETWYLASDGLPLIPPNCACNVSSLLFDPEHSNRLYAATDLGVYVSFDQANSWQPLWENMEANTLAFNLSMLYMGSDNGIFASYNGGTSWFQLGDCGVKIEVYSLAFDPTDTSILWAATNQGLWKCVIQGDLQ